MTSSPGNRRRSTTRTSPPPDEPQPRNIPRWLETLAGFSLRFDRFLRDIVGLLLLAGAFLLLFGLLNISQGSVITPWANFVRRWFGWGAFGFTALLALGGVMALWRGARKRTFISLGQVLALEGILFVGVALLSLFGGQLIERAESGLDGGYIGWGLAEIVSRVLPPPWGTVFLIFVFIYFAAVGFGIAGILVKIIDRWLIPSEQCTWRPGGFTGRCA